MVRVKQEIPTIDVKGLALQQPGNMRQLRGISFCQGASYVLAYEMIMVHDALDGGLAYSANMTGIPASDCMSISRATEGKECASRTRGSTLRWTDDAYDEEQDHQVLEGYRHHGD